MRRLRHHEPYRPGPRFLRPPLDAADPAEVICYECGARIQCSMAYQVQNDPSLKYRCGCCELQREED